MDSVAGPPTGPSLWEDLHAKARPQLAYGYVDRERQSAVMALLGSIQRTWESHQAVLRGACSAYQAGAQAPRPQVMPLPSGSHFACITHEAYLELNAGETVSARIGKLPFDSSAAAMLSSPMNPAMSGLALYSPFESSEGIWQGYAHWAPDQEWAFSGGAAVSGTSLPEFQAFPFLRGRRALGEWDFQLLATLHFAGSGISWQASPSWLLYAEANSAKDALLGSQVTTDWIEAFPVRLTAEYLRNANGQTGSASTERLQRALTARVPRMESYFFPSPSGIASPPWGATQFLSRNLVFADARIADRISGPYSSILISSDDLSWHSILGYRLENPFVPKGSEASIRIEWRRFGGGPFSEFGEAKRVAGEDQLWLTLTF